MSIEIRKIQEEDLRNMEGQEGLVFQGCGGDLQEWVDGINHELTEAGILLHGAKLKDVSTFQHGDTTCLLFHMVGTPMDLGKLAMWRLQTHATFGGTWLSDYVDNRLGGFLHRQKPDCELIGQDGNIYNLMGLAARALRQNGQQAEADAMLRRIHRECQSYDQALGVISDYVNITGPEEQGMRMT